MAERGDFSADFERSVSNNEVRFMAAFHPYSEWLLDESRAPGDFTAIESDFSITLLFLYAEDDNRYYTTNVRHIRSCRPPLQVGTNKVTSSLRRNLPPYAN